MKQPEIASLDHLVLTVGDLEATLAFYSDILGMKVERFTGADGSKRHALKFGRQKINVHRWGAEYDPKAAHPGPGSTDMCLLSDTSLEDWQAHFAANKVAIEEGPVSRTGATGPMHSLYIRDPDGNLIEVSTPD
ncbi:MULTISPECIES: VOC family protein [Roseobacteraceae]|uniref:Virulence protein n=1 Tax=Pseudosulfitobacter pseudonitzschiae TaxID=1402135 RepID=A0A221K5F0_9RHOB|nr:MULTISPECIES: VOC family protein [Roseobacteraceae]ASM74241.1 virulence protein [Pseudosulfitobacter pseudonitzschiae]